MAIEHSATQPREFTIDLDHQQQVIQHLRATRQLLADLKERGIDVSAAKNVFDQARPALVASDLESAQQYAEQASALAQRLAHAAATAQRTAEKAITTVNAMMEKAEEVNFDTKRVYAYYTRAHRAFEKQAYGEALEFCTKVRNGLYREHRFLSLTKALRAVSRHLDTLELKNLDLSEPYAMLEAALPHIDARDYEAAFEAVRQAASMLDDIEYNAAITNSEKQQRLIRFNMGRLAVPLTGRSAHPEPAKPEEPPTPTVDDATGLIDDYTFETFVVGESNRLCYTIGLEIAASPGEKYNPFFIYGGVGIGKTHLLNAIGNSTQRQAPSSVVYYTTAEAFVSAYRDAKRDHTLSSFRDHYRTLDLLLIDDIQFFPRDQEVIDEFYHTFNSLYNAHKQLVISSDRTAEELGWLGSNLVSRFKSGLFATIKPPQLPVRLTILEHEAKTLKQPVPSSVLEIIARMIQSNIRELKGALRRVTAQAFVTNAPITDELALAALEDFVPLKTRIEVMRSLQSSDEIGMFDPGSAAVDPDADAADSFALDRVMANDEAGAEGPGAMADPEANDAPTHDDPLGMAIYERSALDQGSNIELFAPAPGSAEMIYEQVEAAPTIGPAVFLVDDFSDLDEDDWNGSDPETPTPTTTGPHLEPGRSYLVLEERARHCYQLANELLPDLSRSLILTREHPRLLRARCRLADHPGRQIVWLTEKSSDEATIDPALPSVADRIRAFLSDPSPGLLLLDGLEQFMVGSDFDTILKFLRSTIDEVAETAVRFLVPINPLSLSPQHLGVLKREMEVIAPRL